MSKFAETVATNLSKIECNEKEDVIAILSIIGVGTKDLDCKYLNTHLSVLTDNEDVICTVLCITQAVQYLASLYNTYEATEDDFIEYLEEGGCYTVKKVAKFYKNLREK